MESKRKTNKKKETKIGCTLSKLESFKKIVFNSALILVTACLLTSCGSIMKRHYMKGYFVENKKHNSNSNIDVKNKVDNNLEASLPKKKGPKTGINITGFEENNIIESGSFLLKNSHRTEYDSKKKYSYSESDKYTSIDFSQNTSTRNNKRVTEKEIKNAEGRVATDDTTAREGLSLFWIVILIILIAYIIGLFAIADIATAGWIHILGVIALVLLILWLLRVI